MERALQARVLQGTKGSCLEETDGALHCLVQMSSKEQTLDQIKEHELLLEKVDFVSNGPFENLTRIEGLQSQMEV